MPLHKIWDLTGEDRNLVAGRAFEILEARERLSDRFLRMENRLKACA